MQISLLTVALVSTITVSQISQSKGLFDYACDPRHSEISCLLGCLGCFEYYGGQVYNMAACCQECRNTNAQLVDDGPVLCSPRFIKASWIRKFGK